MNSSSNNNTLNKIVRRKTKRGLCKNPVDDAEHENELILNQKDVHDKVQSKEAVLLKQDSNYLTPAATHIIESIENIAECVSMPSLNFFFFFASAKLWQVYLNQV